MAPAEEIDICDRCGKTANDFKGKKGFKLYLKENNGKGHWWGKIEPKLFRTY